MKVIYSFIFIIFFVSCSEKQNIEHLIFKKKIAFKPDSDKPYSGYVFKLDKNGEKSFEGHYLEGKRDGEFIFYEDGRLEKKENYKEGQRHGEFIYYYDNGQIQTRKNYKDGEEDGFFESYNKNGNKIFEGTYSDGLESGKHSHWYSDGKQIQTELEYLKGSIVIESVIENYPNGKLKTDFKRIDKNVYKKFEYFLNGSIKHEVSFGYNTYEGIKNNHIFYMNIVGSNVGESTVTFSLGIGFFYFGEEYFKNEAGQIIQKTKYFFPKHGSISKKYSDSYTSIYNDIVSYTEYYTNGILTKKCASSETGQLGCVPGDGKVLDDMMLIEK